MGKLPAQGTARVRELPRCALACLRRRRTGAALRRALETRRLRTRLGGKLPLPRRPGGAWVLFGTARQRTLQPGAGREAPVEGVEDGALVGARASSSAPAPAEPSRAFSVQPSTLARRPGAGASRPAPDRASSKDRQGPPKPERAHARTCALARQSGGSAGVACRCGRVVRGRPRTARAHLCRTATRRGRSRSGESGNRFGGSGSGRGGSVGWWDSRLYPCTKGKLERYVGGRRPLRAPLSR